MCIKYNCVYLIELSVSRLLCISEDSVSALVSLCAAICREGFVWTLSRYVECFICDEGSLLWG